MFRKRPLKPEIRDLRRRAPRTRTEVRTGEGEAEVGMMATAAAQIAIIQVRFAFEQLLLGIPEVEMAWG